MTKFKTKNSLAAKPTFDGDDRRGSDAVSGGQEAGQRDCAGRSLSARPGGRRGLGWIAAGMIFGAGVVLGDLTARRQLRYIRPGK